MSKHGERALMKMRRSVGNPWVADRLLTACMALALCLIVAVASAEEAAITDCRPHAVYADAEGALLTQEEKIARMDQAFHDSLARFEQCQQGTSGEASGSTGRGTGRRVVSSSEMSGGVNDAHRADSMQGDTDRKVASATIESVTSSDMQGTSVPVPDTPSSDTRMTGNDPLSGTPSGEIPKDILALRRSAPSDPDNDSKLEAQIRLAATEETDPKKKARLWNEYRRYKGLPLKPFVGEQEDADARK